MNILTLIIGGVVLLIWPLCLLIGTFACKDAAKAYSDTSVAKNLGSCSFLVLFDNYGWFVSIIGALLVLVGLVTDAPSSYNNSQYGGYRRK